MDVVSGMESVVQWTQAIQSTCEGSGNAGALGDVMQLVMAFKEDCNSGHVTSVQEQLDGLYTEEKSLAQLSEELRSVSEELRGIEAECDAFTQRPQLQSAEVEKKLFQQCCGLEFRVTTDRAVSLVFRCVDPANPSRKFSVTMDVVEEEGKEQPQWTLVGMNPPVTGLHPLVKELNSSNDFHQFCWQLRTRLQKHQEEETVHSHTQQGEEKGNSQ